jgi:small-conductance mechanosensitive channel
LILVVIGSLTVSQLKIETDLIDQVIQILLFATAGALTLALGLGTRDLARHVVAGVYARDIYRPGMDMAVGDDKGVLVDVGAVSTRIRKKNGQVAYVPNAQLTETVVQGSDTSEVEEADGKKD